MHTRRGLVGNWSAGERFAARQYRSFRVSQGIPAGRDQMQGFRGAGSEIVLLVVPPRSLMCSHFLLPTYALLDRYGTQVFPTMRLATMNCEPRALPGRRFLQPASPIERAPWSPQRLHAFSRPLPVLAVASEGLPCAGLAPQVQDVCNSAEGY